MKKLFKYTGMTALTAIFLLGFCPMAWAEYEIENYSANVPIGVPAQQGPAEDLEVTWDEVTIPIGEGTLLGYVYIWNDSSELLDDTQLNQTTNDGTVEPGLDPPFLTKAKEDFAGDDSNDFRYLHVKTFYLSFTEGQQLSDDVVIGPFNFDNVPPTGTIALDTSVPGQTATTSSVNPVTLTLSATDDTDTVYLGRTTTFAQATEYAFANTLTFEVSEGSGSKIIYAWFEDQAGNRSGLGTLTFTLFEGKTMSPIGAVTIEVGGTQTFTIQGAEVGETFNWQIIDASRADVASPLSATDVLSVDITGDNEGTFKVQATSNTDSAVYISGTVTVVQTYTLGDVDGDGVITIADVRLAFRFFLGLESPTATQFNAAKIYGDGPTITIDDVRGVFRIFLGLPI